MSTKHKVDFKHKESVVMDIVRHIKRDYPDVCEDMIADIGIDLTKYSVGRQYVSKEKVLIELDFDENLLIKEAVRKEEEWEDILKYL